MITGRFDYPKAREISNGDVCLLFGTSDEVADRMDKSAELEYLTIGTYLAMSKMGVLPGQSHAR